MLYLKDAKLVHVPDGGKKLDSSYVPLNYQNKYEFPNKLLGVVKTGCAVTINVNRLLGFCIECNKEIYSNSMGTRPYAHNRSIKFIEGEKLICRNCSPNFVECTNCGGTYRKQDIADY